MPTSNVSGTRHVGGLAGVVGGRVSHSHAAGEVRGDKYVGGLVGRNDALVENSSAKGTVNGDRYVGGLVGSNAGPVNNSYAAGDVSGSRSVGGLVGRNGGPVNNSYAAAEVSGSGGVGGLVGYNYGGTVSNSYATCEVSGSSSVGGLVGANSGVVENSHYNIDEVLINGGNHITIGGLFDTQYQDWLSSNKTLNIEDYSDTLVPSGDYYEISCVDGLQDLLGFADDEGYYFRLTEDIDLSDEPGLYIPYLSAKFDGAGHTVTGLNIDMSFASDVGMFGQVNGGKVTNIGVVDADVSGSSSIGGLVGRNDEGTVENSYATGEMSGSNSIGGLVGSNSGAVENSYATGGMSGSNSVGGLVGSNSGAVNNSYATGNVSGDDEIGGLVGFHFGTVESSYATGNVSGNNEIGGLVGENWNQAGTVSNSFWDIETTGQNESDGGTGKNTAEMKDAATYTDTYTEGLDEPWDFVGDPNDDKGDKDIWDMDEDEELNDGYPFLSWEIRSELRIQVEGNGTVEVDGKEVEDGWTELYDDGTEVDITAIPDEGYEFHGWGGDNKGDEKNITINMDSNKIITAHFEKEVVEYNLTIDIEGEGSTVPVEGNHTYEEGTNVTITAAPAEGWEFVEWIGDRTESKRNITVTMDSDKNITAVFEELSYYTLSVNVEGEGTVEIDPDKEEYEEGTEVTLTAIPDENWYFKGWTGDYTGTKAEMNMTMDEDKNITAVFEEVEFYELAINVEGEGSTTLEEGTHSYADGEVVTVEAIPAEGWRFVEWKGDETGTETTINITMDENKSITANFEEEGVRYDLIIGINGEGSTVPEKGTHTYEEGTEVTIEATPAAGWEFIEWTGDETGNETTIEITMDKDKEITANFEEVVEYALTIVTEGEGAVEVDGEKVEDDWTETYEEGTEVELKAIPDEGYVFKEWTGGYEGDEEEITVVMDENKTITAHFEEEPAAEIIVSNFNVDVDGLEVTVTADVENVGDAEGTIDLIVEGEVVESFTLGSGDVDTIEKTHEFEDEGEYSVELGDESETVTVEEGDEEDGIGMTTIIGMIAIIVIIIILVVVGYMMKGGEESDTGTEEEYGEEKYGEEEAEENKFREDTYSDL